MLKIFGLIVLVAGFCVPASTGTNSNELEHQNAGAKAFFYNPSKNSLVEVKNLKKNTPVDNRQDRSSVTPDPLTVSGVRQASSDRKRVGAPVIDAPAQGGGALGLRYWVELVDSSDGSAREVPASRTFRSGERIRLRLQSNADGHIAILQIPASGGAGFLYPDPGKGLIDNSIRAHEDCIIPGEKAWFRFDSNPGVERLLVMLSRDKSQLGILNGSTKRLDESKTQEILQAVSEGSKDLYIETETEVPGEIGTYAAHAAGKPITLLIELNHR